MLKCIRGFFFLGLVTLLVGAAFVMTNNPFASKKDRELNIFAYSDFLDLDMIAKFEAKRGVTVNIHFFSSNEELLTKLALTKGKGIDVMFPSDYACRILADNNLIQEIDKSRLNFMDRIYPFLLNNEYDPENRFSIPYMWEGYGFAIDPLLISSNLRLQDIFSSDHKKVMTPDPVEIVAIASRYLFGKKKKLSKEEEAKVMKFLKSQQDSIEAYADFRAKDIITSKNAPFSLLKTSYIDGLKEENDEIEFILPVDEFFISIENAVISKQSDKLDDVYAFLNHLYTPENLALTVDQFPSYPACPDALDHLKKHHEVFLQMITEIEKREDDHLLFSYVTNQDKIRKIFIESKV